ncbi:methyltransferase [Spirochaetota bacterium]|nr:methyltransferase [Spirochaetota bacterium]
MKSIPNPRIIGGFLKGSPLKFAYTTKPAPTQAIIRKSIFDQLQSIIENAKFLDGFSGTGAVGIEALSRGARHVVFIENDVKLASSLTSNLKQLGLSEEKTSTSPTANKLPFNLPLLARSKVWYGDFKKYVPHKSHFFDIVFLDPPYEVLKDIEALKQMLMIVINRQLLKPSGRIILERSEHHAKRHERRDEDLTTFYQFLTKLNLTRSDVRLFGKTRLETYRIRDK